MVLWDSSRPVFNHLTHNLSAVAQLAARGFLWGVRSFAPTIGLGFHWASVPEELVRLISQQAVSVFDPARERHCRRRALRLFISWNLLLRAQRLSATRCGKLFIVGVFSRGSANQRIPARESTNLKTAFHTSIFLFLIALIGAPRSTAAQTSPPSRPDGIFTPTISIVTSIDKTGRPMTVESRQLEPRLTQSIAAGNPTGDSYIIHFPQGDAGGPCLYTGNARYLIEGNGTLTFQILADCGKLRRGYNYMICRLDPSLRCTEAPWWNFRDRTYVIAKEGVSVNGSAPVPWQDANEAPQLLQQMSQKIKALNDRVAQLTATNTVHGRAISCREYHPETKSYHVWEFPTTCLIETACNGMPNLDSMRDGDPVDLNSSAGTFVKQQSKASDFSNWLCWVRMQ
jgi:hypothetical protein